MANFSLRMLAVFLVGALMLNISNYLFIKFFYSTPNSPYVYPKTVSGMEIRRSLNPRYWSTAVVCDKEGGSSESSQMNNSEPDMSTYSAYYLMFERTRTTTEKEIEKCPELPPGLGPELDNRSLIARNLHEFETKSNEVKPGGIYKPTGCKALQSVAIIIAYRGCKNYLATFMNIIHPFLIKQQLDYQIFVVEQSNRTQPYNRGKLLNVGFAEANRFRKDGFDCIVIHESHIVPMDSRNLYRCTWFPRQLATTIERPVKSSYVPLIGGALAMTPEQYLKVNGFSNAYWGNDADYYDLFRRINSTNYFIENSLQHVGKYKTIRKGLGLWHKSQLLSTPAPLYLLDGLTSLSYNIVSLELRHLYTYLQVNIDMGDDTQSKARMYDKIMNPATYKTTTSLK